MRDEVSFYDETINRHLKWLIQGLRQIPEDRWNWLPDALPIRSARLLADQCISLLFRCKPAPDPTENAATPFSAPTSCADQQASCDILEVEAEWWHCFFPR